MHIGVIGLGRMGGNIARRLMEGGHRCVVFDVNAQAVAELAEHGATSADSTVSTSCAPPSGRKRWAATAVSSFSCAVAAPEASSTAIHHSVGPVRWRQASTRERSHPALHIELPRGRSVDQRPVAQPSTIRFKPRALPVIRFHRGGPNMNVRFSDREEAGRMLADLLGAYARERPIVLALPRGGVPVGNEVAKALNAPLDIWVVRKIGAPEFPELGVGAVAEGGLVHLDHEVLAEVGLTEEEARRLARDKQFEVEERVHRLRGDKPPPDVSGRTVILVDDGIATGGTMRASIAALRKRNPAKIVMAVPVAAAQTLSAMRDLVDDVVCIEAPTAMHAIGQWYEDFAPTTDDDVIALLALAAEPEASADPPPEVEFAVDGVTLAGRLTVPEGANGLILFAHGSGSSRHSPRNRFVAEVLNQAGLGTLLFDLLTPGEEHDRARVFDIGMLGHRLAEVTRQVRGDHAWIGYFGASTGAAAALWAAAEPDLDIASIVSRGGRPDLAESKLGQVRAPTLLIVGGLDEVVLDLNRHARKRLRCTCALTIVPGATHLFEEPGALRTVADLARDWFTSHVPADTRR